MGSEHLDRGTSPVVGKALEASLVVLYIGLLSALLYGHVVPDYRTTAGAEIGDRVLAKTSQQVQQAVPPNASTVAVRMRVGLPQTIRGHRYRIRVVDRSLVLVHPNAAISGRARLALPSSIESVRGSWRSDELAVVSVRSVGSGLSIRLVSGGGG